MKRGFTLIELLVVVLIIGILAAVAVPQYTKAVEKSRMAEAITLLGDVMKGEQIYRLDTGNFTPDLRKLVIEMPGVSQVDVDTIDTEYYTITLADEGARAIANRKGNAAAGPSLIFTIDSSGEIKRYCNDSTANVKLCAGLRSSQEWESGEYTEPSDDDDDNNNNNNNNNNNFSADAGFESYTPPREMRIGQRQRSVPFRSFHQSQSTSGRHGGARDPQDNIALRGISLPAVPAENGFGECRRPQG